MFANGFNNIVRYHPNRKQSNLFNRLERRKSDAKKSREMVVDLNGFFNNFILAAIKIIFIKGCSPRKHEKGNRNFDRLRRRRMDGKIRLRTGRTFMTKIGKISISNYTKSPVDIAIYHRFSKTCVILRICRKRQSL